MKWFWKAIAAFLNCYGKYGAGLASVHGSYEPPVPELLQHAGK